MALLGDLPREQNVSLILSLRLPLAYFFIFYD
jgi:hypothetical protein